MSLALWQRAFHLIPATILIVPPALHMTGVSPGYVPVADAILTFIPSMLLGGLPTPDPSKILQPSVTI